MSMGCVIISISFFSIASFPFIASNTHTKRKATTPQVVKSTKHFKILPSGGAGSGRSKESSGKASQNVTRQKNKLS